MSVKFAFIEMDQIKEGIQVHGALKEIANQKTVPCTYINGEKIGGFDDLKSASESGYLRIKL